MTIAMRAIAASVSDMEEFEEDEETLAAIDRGIKALMKAELFLSKKFAR
jgi:hypothetical protein